MRDPPEVLVRSLGRHVPGAQHASPRVSTALLESRADEEDRFLWFCEKCQARLFEIVKHVGDYREDPVSRAYEAFYSDLSHRTCAKCGHVAPLPHSDG